MNSGRRQAVHALVRFVRSARARYVAAGRTMTRASSDQGLASEVDMHARHLHEHRTAVGVVTRVSDELRADGCEKTSPEVRRVVALENGLAAVAQTAIA